MHAFFHAQMRRFAELLVELYVLSEKSIVVLLIVVDQKFCTSGQKHKRTGEGLRLP